MDVAAAVVPQVDDDPARLRAAREAEDPVCRPRRVVENGVVEEVDDASPVDRRHPLRSVAVSGDERLRALRHPVEEQGVRRAHRADVLAAGHGRELDIREPVDEKVGARSSARCRAREDLGGHEVRVAVRGERERVVVRHERIDEAQDVRDRPPWIASSRRPTSCGRPGAATT